MKTPRWLQYPTYSWNKKHAIIIGGGIAGAQMAWHLCQAGWQVTLIERHSKLATEASGNPAGVISPKMTAKPSDGEDFYTQSFHYTLSLLKTLEDQGKQIEWDACGTLQLVHNLREDNRWQALKDRHLSTDFIQLLEAEETQQIAGIPLCSTQSYKSSYFPNGAWINPVSFTTALSDHPNCKIIFQSEIIHLKKTRNEWQVLDSKTKLIDSAEVVVIASGKELVSFEQSNFLPNMPVAGQTTLSPMSEHSRKLKTVIGHEGYLTPAINNQHTFGATFERNVHQAEITPEADIANLNQLKQYLPEFAQSLTKTSSAHGAVRLTSPDRFPYVGGLPDKDFYQNAYDDLHQGKQWKDYPPAKYQKGLFVLGCLGSRGLTTSGYCAKILTELLENELQSKQGLKLLENCHPARFIVKNLKRKLTN